MKLSSVIYQSALKVYKILPFKKGICKLLRALPVRKDKFYKDYLFKGVFDVKLKDGKSFKLYHHGTTIENEIFWKGLDEGWEKVSIDLWRRLSAQSEYIVDIGANTGIYSLLSKTVNPDSKVYAFEPSKRVFDKLQQNIVLNDFSVHSSDVAVSDTNGEAVFYDVDADHQYSASLNKEMVDDSANKKEVRVQTVRLDDYFQTNAIQGLDLIKIDVEKHEAEVINGMTGLIESYTPTFLIEILDDTIGESIEKVLGPYGYLYFNIDEINPPVQVSHLRKSAHYNYLICSGDTAKSLNLL